MHAYDKSRKKIQTKIVVLVLEEIKKKVLNIILCKIKHSKTLNNSMKLFNWSHYISLQIKNMLKLRKTKQSQEKC